MGIEVRSLYFSNVLVYETSQLKEEWQEPYFMMEDLALEKDFYKSGPVFFSVAPIQNEAKFGQFTYYLPINEPIPLEEEGDFRFLEKFSIEEALVLRQADQELDFYAAYQKIKDYASDQKIDLVDTYYVVLIEAYGDLIIDLYVPIKERGER
ncbi:DUF5085 family protein [Neobacillus soli]|uniref:DUF5085 family protein n=1 Tax=Neobacillus soli TaxID=220688 RepID=UPI000825FCAC|nr:DUF5085 family protein [Neobacillus soli]